MSRTLIAVLVFAGWSAAMFGAGWAWRGDRADAAETQGKLQVVTTAVIQSEAAREQEHQQADTLAEIGAEHEEDRAAAAAVPDAVVADLRAGVLRLRDDLATCRLSGAAAAAAGAGERHAPAELRSEVAGAAVRIARDADDQLRACQAVVRADRGEAPP